MTEFFAPTNTDALDEMLAQYRHTRQKIEHVHAIMTGKEYSGVDQYFLDAQPDSHRAVHVRGLFNNLTGAIAQLNSQHWNQALKLTDVLSIMPAKRINEWNDQIREAKCPDFTEDAVRTTIHALLDQRLTFFAERVDGIFRSLSGEHVTNRPEGFFKRMIINGFFDRWGYLNYDRCNLINDLRCVIAKILNREPPRHGDSNQLVECLKFHYGQWQEIDGGSLRIKLYMKGTIHLEIHPDLCWQLNQVLAVLHPLAIPASFRSKPAKKAKTYQPLQEFLPYPVTFILGRFVSEGQKYGQKWVRLDYSSYYSSADKHVKQAVNRVLEYLGGVYGRNAYNFDYDVMPVLREVAMTGRVPDARSHQYYPTPERVASLAAELADVQSGEEVLEPSAGQGALVDALGLTPLSVTMVELSSLHCKILEAKKGVFGEVICADFIDWEAKNTKRFDCVVMNPPFSQGRWQSHLQAAARCIKAAGRLVAVLPASAKGKDDLLPDMACEWSDVLTNEFDGTSVSVVVLKAVFK